MNVGECEGWVCLLYVYYESIKRKPKIRGIYESRCDERLQTKSKEFTRLTYTGLVLELEHLKTETSLISERFANAMGECENFFWSLLWIDKARAKEEFEN